MTQKVKSEVESSSETIDLPLKIDEKNKLILEVLKRDGRASFADIAKKLDMNESTVRKRVNKMIDDGIIDHFTVVLNPNVSGKTIISFLTVIPASHYKINELSNEVIQIPEVIEAFYMSGKCGLLLKVHVSSLTELDLLLEKMREIHGIGEIESCIVIRQLKSYTC
ncbi:MAG: Lrp/AsnC family transcriptional regulator [Candidatus Helarchaeota archaeon]